MKKKPENVVTLEKLIVEYVNVDSILPNTYNPNRQDPRQFEMLCKSIEEDGFTQPVVVRRKDRMIVDGEHRWRVAQKLGYKQVPVVFVDMTDEQMRIATLRHNRARGAEQMDLTANVLKELAEMGAVDHAQSSLMLSEDDVKRLLEESKATNLAAEDFSAAWVPESQIRAEVDKRSSETASSVIAASSSALTNRNKPDDERERETRLVLVVTESQLKKIKTVFGHKPAAKLFGYVDAEYSKIEKTEAEAAEKEAKEKADAKAKKKQAKTAS